MNHDGRNGKVWLRMWSVMVGIFATVAVAVAPAYAVWTSTGWSGSGNSTIAGDANDSSSGDFAPPNSTDRSLLADFVANPEVAPTITLQHLTGPHGEGAGPVISLTGLTYVGMQSDPNDEWIDITGSVSHGAHYDNYVVWVTKFKNDISGVITGFQVVGTLLHETSPVPELPVSASAAVGVGMLLLMLYRLRKSGETSPRVSVH